MSGGTHTFSYMHFIDFLLKFSKTVNIFAQEFKYSMDVKPVLVEKFLDQEKMYLLVENFPDCGKNFSCGKLP